MTTSINDSHMVSISQIKEFIKVAKDIEFRGAKRKEKYEWIEEAFLRFKYFTLRKKERSVIKRYLILFTTLFLRKLLRERVRFACLPKELNFPPLSRQQLKKFKIETTNNTIL